MAAVPFMDMPPSYEEATTYTIHLKPGDDKEINISEFFRLSSEGYTLIRIKVAGTTPRENRTRPARMYPVYHNYTAERIPHCRLLRQHDYDDHYRVLLDNTIYESNLSYDDAILLVGKLVSVNACRF
ncbi:hypothetical protein [Endozoicomonas sp. SCSIO W0465]|uniref:hypothetical protein n=1 Tax=Endozoicomonas sp. SCSIO W0465 TaxID=2918516 RepID=UPI002075C084|nr:hypothetical protein [Endozoicomonas sp. SCSIO W0465]USE35950.1 hypothetical protein MJO57_28465 [Endozoicomonas sp. SCSIO W0465]